MFGGKKVSREELAEGPRGKDLALLAHILKVGLFSDLFPKLALDVNAKPRKRLSLNSNLLHSTLCCAALCVESIL